MDTRKRTSCAICENLNLASICAKCVNNRINHYKSLLKSLKSVRDSLSKRLSGELRAKRKADCQFEWIELRNEKIVHMKENLSYLEKKLSQGKSELRKKSNDLKVKYALLEVASMVLDNSRVDQFEKFYPNLIRTMNLEHMHITSELLHKQSVVLKQICKLFPQCKVNLDGDVGSASSGKFDQICNACFPIGLDLHSVPSEELAASLGYMVQLLNLLVHILAVPILHNSGFAGSCSRIWQRYSYWDARPSSPRNEYPLFIQRQKNSSTCGDNFFSDKNSSNYGVVSLESEKALHFGSTSGDSFFSDKNSSNYGVVSLESEKALHFGSRGNSSFNYSSASHSIDAHKDLKRGISLLKQSVACIVAYCYNSLYLDVPSDLSTFEAFGKLLTTLSSSKKVRALLSLKTAKASTWPIMRDKCGNLVNSSASFLHNTEVADPGNSESLADGWDMVEHPIFSPPTMAEDIEDWTRAMIIDGLGQRRCTLS